VHHDIPANPGEISAGWLTTALREAGAISTSSVTTCRPEIIGQDWGFTGIVARVHLEYDRPEHGAPETVVAKFPNAAGETLSAFRTRQQQDPELARRYLHRCAREVWFYQQVAPESPLPAPRLYYGVSDLEGGRFVLLLEDLRGMRSGDAVLGCDDENAQSVLDAIAPFHATWWGRDRDGHFTWIPFWPEDPDGRVALYQRRVDPFLERYGERVPDTVRLVAKRLTNQLRSILDELAAAPRTVGHADLHLDNVLFNDSGAATIIDWQTVLWIPAVCDIAAFIAGSIHAQPGTESADRLVRHYHASLTAHGVRDYPLDELVHHYRLALLNVLVGTVYWLGGADPARLSGRELTLLNNAIDNNRLFSLVIDHDLGTLLD
jgi:aminoglycoside phosphotransferase (APT) family kinase protein